MSSITFPSGGTAIPGELYSPTAAASGRSVIIAHGTDGMSPTFEALIRGFANNLASTDSFV